jgi:hypothetical protein
MARWTDAFTKLHPREPRFKPERAGSFQRAYFAVALLFRELARVGRFAFQNSRLLDRSEGQLNRATLAGRPSLSQPTMGIKVDRRASV